MNIAISNLAFNNTQIDYVLNILKKNNIKYIEGVLSKIKNFNEICNEDIKKYNEFWLKNNIEICSFQSIFFNSNIKSFNDNLCIDHLFKVINFCKLTNAKIIVLGSPTMRSKNSEKNLSKILKTIDQKLFENKITLCIEPNSKIFNGFYFYNLEEISNFIYENNYSNIKTMIDTFNLINEGFDPIKEFEKHKNIIKHIHISEKDLNPITNKNFHYEFSKFLKKNNDNIITYEIKEHKNFEKIIYNFCEIYGE